MNPDFRKVALIAASLGLLLSLFLALRPDGEEAAAPPRDTVPATTAATTTAPATTVAPATTAAPEPRTFDIDATSGEVVRATVEVGERVILNVSADTADHVHVHGYDLMADVAPGAPAKLSFVADAPGLFEIELEERGLHIAELEVRP